MVFSLWMIEVRKVRSGNWAVGREAMAGKVSQETNDLLRKRVSGTGIVRQKFLEAFLVSADDEDDSDICCVAHSQAVNCRRL